MSAEPRLVARTCALFAGGSLLALAAPAWSQATAPAAESAAKPAAAAAAAAPAAVEVEEVVVNGVQFTGKVTPLALSTNEKSDIAAVTALSTEDIMRQSLGANVDVFRSVPGVQVGDFGQVGIANGITLRGWPGANDSSSVAFFMDGVQRNDPSGTGANGYLDINNIIPETLAGMTLVKGPFDTRYGGNFALGGSAVVTTVDMMPASLSVSGGSYGNARLLGTYGLQSGSTTFYTAIQGMRADGYQKNADQRQLATFSKLGFDAGPGRLWVSLQTFDIKYGSPGYIDLANLKAGRISARSDVNDSDGGTKKEYTFITHYTLGDASRGLDFTAFADHEHRQRFATFTPYPQTATEDKRTWYGGSAEGHMDLTLFGSAPAQLLAGATVRHDDINANTVPSTNGVKLETPDPADLYGFQRADIGQTQASAYANLSVKPVDWIKLTAGVRYDHFAYDIDNQTYVSATNKFATAHVTANTGTVSPKLAIAIEPTSWLTVYANYGQSISSPDAGRDLVVNPNLSSTELKSKEIGVAYNAPGGRLHLQVNAYETTHTNEVTFVGLTAVNNGETKRSGYDIESSAVAVKTDQLAARVYANYSYVDAKLASGSLIPNVAKWIASYGVHADYLPSDGSMHRVTADLGQEWVGPQALDSPKTMSSDTYSRIAAKLAYEMPEMHDLSLWTSAIVYTGHTYDEFGFVLSGRAYVTSLPRTRWLVGVSAKF
jgi:outer membrane receptor protein involved in Fe transport